MYTRGRFLSRINPYGLLEEPPQGRRRGFILRGHNVLTNGVDNVALSRQLGPDWYHFRFLSFFDDTGTAYPMTARFVARANGALVGEYFTNLILPYIGKRHLIDFEAIVPPSSLFEVRWFLNNGAADQQPELVLTGYLSRYPNRLDSEDP